MTGEELCARRKLRQLVQVAVLVPLLACGSEHGASARSNAPSDAPLPAAPRDEAEARADPLPDVMIHARNASVGNVDLHWLEAGPSDGPPVVLLHGAKYTAQTWRELGTLELLAREDYRVLAIDLPGGRGATPSAEHDADTFLGELLSALELERPVVVSPSMSGRFALPLVASASERLAGFVPVAPAEIDAFETKLSNSRVPTLILWGSADDVVPVERAEDLRRALPDARVVVLEGAGHACYLDAPEPFHAELLVFLQSVLSK